MLPAMLAVSAVVAAFLRGFFLQVEFVLDTVFHGCNLQNFLGIFVTYSQVLPRFNSLRFS